MYRNGDHGNFTEEVAGQTKFTGYHEGEPTPQYDGETDSKDNPKAAENYAWKQWDIDMPTIDAAKADKNSIIELTGVWGDDKNNSDILDDQETFTVIYNYKGMDNNDLKETYTATLNESTPQPQNVPTIEKKTIEWTPELAGTVKAEDADAEGKITYTGTWYDDENENGIADVHEYYTLTFKLNGGNYGGSTADVILTVHYNQDITIPQAPERSGYKFTYWQGSQYYPNDNYKVTGEHTFVAQWQRNDIPKTGDENNLPLWIMTLVTSSLAAMYIGIRNFKKKEEF